MYIIFIVYIQTGRFETIRSSTVQKIIKAIKTRLRTILTEFFSDNNDSCLIMIKKTGKHINLGVNVKQSFLKSIKISKH